MTDIDLLLARMGAAPPDPRLAGIEEAVLAGLDRARTPVIERAGLGAVAALALMLGVMAGALPASLPASMPAHTPAPHDPLAMDTLAPSTLLADAH